MKLLDSNDVFCFYGRCNWIYMFFFYNKFKVLLNVNCIIYYNLYGVLCEMYILFVDSLYVLNSFDYILCI